MKRRILILSLFIVAWLMAGTLSVVHTPLQGGLSLATTALALLIALFAGDFVARLGVPALTGYVAAGIIMGPVSGLLNGALLWDLLPIQEAALAVLAFAAGSQLNLRLDTRLARPAIATAVLTGALAVIVITGLALVIGTVSASLIPTLTFNTEAALFIGLLTVGTSPTIVGWIISTVERPAELSALALSTSLVRGLLVLTGVAIIALSQDTPEDGAFVTLIMTPAVALTLALILRGTAPRLDRRAALPIGVLLSLTPPVIAALGAEPVLTLALVGVLTRHWTPEARRTHFDAGIADLKLPAALVLFTLLGATIPEPSFTLLALAFSLFAVRGATLWLSTLVAARWSNAPAGFRSYGWLMLLPQGGVTLGALGSLAVIAPDTIQSIRQPIEALVALGLLIGPVACRVALGAVGEQRTQGQASETSGSAPLAVDLSDEPQHPWRDPMATLVGPDDDVPRAAWGGTVQHLVVLRSRVREQVVGARLERIAKAHKAASTLARQIVQNAGEAIGRCEDGDMRLEHLNEARTSLAEGARAELATLLNPPSASEPQPPGLIELLADALTPIVRAAPTLLEVSESERHVLWAADDSQWVRLGKLGKRGLRRTQNFLGRERPNREVPYRRLVRRTLSGEMLTALGPVEAMISRAEYKALRRLEAHLLEAEGVLVEAAQRSEEPTELRTWIHERVSALRDASKDAQSDILFLAEEPLHRISEAMAAAMNRLAHMADIAGTFALTENAVRYATVAPQVRDAITNAAQDRAAWDACKRAQVHRTLLALQLAELEVGLRDLVMGRALGPAVRMHSRVQALMQSGQQLVESVRASVDSGTTPATAGAEASAAEALLNDLQRRIGRPLEGLINGLRSGGIIDRLIGALETATAALPERVDLLAEPQILGLVRGASFTDLPTSVAVRETARAFFDRRVAVSLAEHSRALETSAEEARAGIRDAQRLLSVHVARATSADQRQDAGGPRESDEGVHRLTLEALDTVLERFTHEVAQISETSTALMLEIAKTEADAVRELWVHLHDAAIKPQLEQAVWGLWRTLRESAERLAEHPYARHVRDAMMRVQRRVRATQESVEARLDTTLTGPTRVRKALKALDPLRHDMPYVYGKLFALTATENDAFLLGRERELAVLRKRADGRGYGAAIVIGERGMGRSSLVRVALAHSARDRQVIWLDTERPVNGPSDVVSWAASAVGLADTAATLETVAAELKQRRAIIVLDDLESLIPRSLEGLEALEALMTLIVATDKHTVWMVTCERHIWRLLTSVTSIADAFDVTVSLNGLSASELREAIERRHRLSGLELRYSRPSSTDLGAWLTHLWGASPAERTFNQLAEASAGNPRSAMHLWQLSLTHLPAEERAVEVVLNKALSLHDLQTLPGHLLPAIGLMFRQSSVDRPALKVALGWSAAQVGAAIHALEVAGLLQCHSRADGEMSWSLVPHACAPVRQFLLDQGLMHVPGRTT
ncbi:MAG: AAA family ATPase [Myxococcota bacterium]